MSSLFRSSLADRTVLYRSGAPLSTGATVRSFDPGSFAPVEGIPPFEVHRTEEGGTTLHLPLEHDDRALGLGQAVGRLDRRGSRYRSYSRQSVPQTEEKASQNGAHPFLILQGSRDFGVFIDYPAEVTFDIGFTTRSLLSITIPSSDFDLYLFEGRDPEAIIREYLLLTGAPYLPPKWAFGYHQCRYSYLSSDEVREVGRAMREHDIPCDAIYLDIDYMDRFKVFTVDEERFGDLPELVAEMKSEGFELVPIVDPGVKVEKGYGPYEEGVRKGYYCLDESGNPFVGVVWPGRVHLPDFLDPRCRRWWGRLHEFFTEMGISGFWNDMNEPEIFFDPRAVEGARRALGRLCSTTDSGEEAIQAIRDAGRLWNDEGTDDAFFHSHPERGKIRHRQVHNLYAFLMGRATAEGLTALLPSKRYFLLSRSSFAGLHRYSGVWTGDNSSWWEHLGLALRGVVSLNMCGFFYSGADVGGHIGDASPDLLVRWMQLGAFLPLYRNHSGKGTRRQEPWQFDQAATAMMRDAVKLRYAFIPYAYSEYLRSVEELTPFIKPLAFAFPDEEEAYDADDQFLFGDSLMVAPILRPNARGRVVLLPGERWLQWNASGPFDRKLEVVEGGWRYARASSGEIPLFMRENRLVVLGVPHRFVGERPTDRLTIIGLVTSSATFVYRDDYGEGQGVDAERQFRLEVEVTKRGGSYDIALSVNLPEGRPAHLQRLAFELYDENGALHESLRDL